MWPDHEEDKIMNKVYAGELSSSPLVEDLEERVMGASMDSKSRREMVLSL